MRAKVPSQLAAPLLPPPEGEVAGGGICFPEPCRLGDQEDTLSLNCVENATWEHIPPPEPWQPPGPVWLLPQPPEAPAHASFHGCKYKFQNSNALPAEVSLQE